MYKVFDLFIVAYALAQTQPNQKVTNMYMSKNFCNST